MAINHNISLRGTFEFLPHFLMVIVFWFDVQSTLFMGGSDSPT
jgi:hypothetical protein